MPNTSQATSEQSSGFLGIRNIHPAARSIISGYIILSFMFSFIGPLTGTFFVLHIIDTFGFAYAGIITSLMALIQQVTDPPSGSLGDWVRAKNSPFNRIPLLHGRQFHSRNINPSQQFHSNGHPIRVRIWKLDK